MACKWVRNFQVRGLVSRDVVCKKTDVGLWLCEEWSRTRRRPKPDRAWSGRRIRDLKRKVDSIQDASGLEPTTKWGCS
jgi:hypothetical protein